MDCYGGTRIAEEGDDPDWLDVARTRLSWFFATDDAALARCVRDVVAELDQPRQALAAFGNAPSPR
jgi:hypothetical protein